MKNIFKTFLLCSIILGFGCLNAISTTTYKIKPNYINVSKYGTKNNPPAGTPKTPSKVANNKVDSENKEYEQYEKLSKSKPMFNSWNTLKAYNKINEVGERLLESSGISENIVFSVVNDREVNAYSSTHAEVVLYTGILRYVETEDELAAIIGHEIGHIINGDTDRARWRKIALILAGTPNAEPKSKAVRNEEYKADITSVDLMVNAEYNPLAEISILNKIPQQQYSDIFSAHPNGRKRITSVYNYINNYYPDYLEKGYPTISYKRALKIIGVE